MISVSDVEQLEAGAHTEQAARPLPHAASADHYSVLKDAIRDVVLLIDATDGQVCDANLAATATYGYSHRELLGLTIFDLRGPETRGDIWRQMAEARSHGLLFETRHVRKGGSAFPVEVSTRGAMLDGRPVLVSVIRDITNTIDLVRASERRLNRAELASRCGNWELHLDNGTILGSVGACEVYGVHSASMELARIQSMVLSDDRPRVDVALRRLLEEDGSYDVEFRIRRADTGAVRDIHSQAFFDRTQRVIFGVVQDITERRQAERRREEAEARVKRLEGIIPICMHCKQIRTDANSWQALEAYITQHSSARFSHSICPNCIATHYPDLDAGD